MKHIEVSTRALSSLINDVNKGKFDFEHPFQRKSDQWSPIMKSKLVDSAIRCYPIYPILVEEYDNGVLGVIDGKQRLTVLASYFNNEFALHKTLLPVDIDGTTYQISGKKFAERKRQKESDTKKQRGRTPKVPKYLDEDVVDRLKNLEIQIYKLKKPTDDDIREIFARINSSKGLNNSQRRTVLESSELSKIIYNLKSHPVFEKITTPAQRQKDEDKDIVRQILMLTESSKEQEFHSFRNNDINKFLEMYNDNINHEKINLIKDGMDALNSAFEEIPIKSKTTAPILIYSYYRVIKDKKGIQKWNGWVKNFFETYNTNEVYKKYCNGAGTASPEMVNGRLQYFKDALRIL